jgi:hypothetical protein
MGTVSQKVTPDDPDAVPNAELDPVHRVRALLRAGSAAEERLLKRERKAEKRLVAAFAARAADRARVQKAEQRLARSEANVIAAETALRQRHEDRALGPDADQDRPRNQD